MSGVYCTEDNYEISPGLFTHSLTKEQVEAQYGCCQKFVCSIPCPASFEAPGVAVKWGVPVAVIACTWVVMGIVIAFFTIKGSAHNFFVCSRSLPLYVVAFALLGQGLDSNATLGNVINSYKYAFWDGAVLPLGLGISLILNGLLLAGPINKMGLLTLPDLFARKYGALMEVLVSLVELVSFTFLLAGNLVGLSLVLNFCFDLPKGASISIAGVLLAVYTASGGLFSVALTDIPQALGGFTAFLTACIYLMTNESGSQAAPPSLGFALPLGDNITAITPGYTGPYDCVDPVTGASTCDNFAYPIGDKLVYNNGMHDTNAYAPFPNAILLNWATIFVLGLGNLCALDFQARCMASRTPKIATIACLIAGTVLIGICIPFGLVAGLARKYLGPDSIYAEFEADSCSLPLGLPSCAQWIPNDKSALFQLLWLKAPRWMGGWVMVGIVTASMSTADGAILATSTVAAHNLWRKIPKIGTKEQNLLLMARLFVIPMTVMACMVASWAYNPAYLLVVAFDIVFAGVLVPLLAAVYYPRGTPNAGLLAMLSGSILRVILEFALPKDGSLVAYGTYALHFGLSTAGLPSFMIIDPPEKQGEMGVWDADPATCPQKKMEDWTGLDSLICPAVSLLVFVGVMVLEHLFPGRDLLFFIPKTWRATQPLYQAVDGSTDADTSRTPALKTVMLVSDKSASGVSDDGVGPTPIPFDDPIAAEVQLAVSGEGLQHRAHHPGTPRGGQAV